MLQRSVGNAAVTAMVIGRGASPRSGAVAIGAPPTPSVERDATEPAPSAELDVQRAPAGTSFAPPVPPSAPNPKADPRFAAVAGATKSAGQQLKKHAPASQEVGRAQAAAKGPGDDKASQAKAVQVDKMAAAKPGGFDKAAFIAAVKKAIAAAAPKNLDEADKFDMGKADGVKGAVMSKVSQGKETSAKSVKDEATKAPDPSVGKDKPVTPAEARADACATCCQRCCGNARTGTGRTGQLRWWARRGRRQDEGRRGHRGTSQEVQRAATAECRRSEEGRRDAIGRRAESRPAERKPGIAGSPNRSRGRRYEGRRCDDEGQDRRFGPDRRRQDGYQVQGRGRAGEDLRPTSTGSSTRPGPRPRPFSTVSTVWSPPNSTREKRRRAASSRPNTRPTWSGIRTSGTPGPRAGSAGARTCSPGFRRS